MKTSLFRWITLWITLLILWVFEAQSQQNMTRYGIFYLPTQTDWQLVPSNHVDFFVFENQQAGIVVRVKKEPYPCASKQDFNKLVLQLTQEANSRNEFVEQRKEASPIVCFEQRYNHLLKIKSRQTSATKFILNPYVEGKVFHIEIMEEGVLNAPTQTAQYFVSLLSLTPVGSAITAQKPTNNNGLDTAPQKDDGLSSFKKVKPVPSGSVPSKSPPTTQNTKNANPSPAATASVEIAMPSPPSITKGTIPEVRFSTTDPCANTQYHTGTIWESASVKTNTLPNGSDLIAVPLLPDLASLPDVAYKSSVTAAFESMRLVYGPMPPDEYKKFEAAWTPLFDFPSQETIDYLNKLNPLVFQFLSHRESYIRTLSDLTMVMFDASTALEAQEQQAWESSMAEAKRYESLLVPLENTLKKIAAQIEAMGNPPNPASAKCDALQRYNKAFTR